MAVDGGEAASGAGAAGRPSLETSALLSRLGDVSLWDLEVTAVEAVSPSMRRIRCTAPGLGQLSYQPGQDLMLAVPGPGNGSFRRRYTIRSLDRAAASVDIDVVLHGDGPAAAWAASCQPGQRIEAIGPRGKVTVQAEADWHLFAGDDSAMPASLAMAESLPTPEDALVVLEVDGVADQQQVSATDGRPIGVHWVHRAGADPASSAKLVAALNGLELPAGRGHAYLAGELRVVADMRRTLVERGLTAAQISAKPYWRAGVANAAHGEPERPPSDE
ncbi:MAG TPA: siderophore-interacting protein [Acidimicrobiales bacterium]|jgi:NADPH-dependent ferric siderophore reductase|nr:siderophore-interacting protein [Acidimicrobiales bacterium]